MRGRLAVVLGALGVAGAFAARLLRQQPPPEPPADAPDARAAELRRKLEESRTLVDERDEFEEAELTVDQAEPVEPDPNNRRRRVHEEGRAAVDRMRGSGDS